MNESSKFLNSVMNSISEHIVVIDQSGMIQLVNQSWINFSQANLCTIKSDNWHSVNYLNVCDESAARGEEFGSAAAGGIRGVIGKSIESFYLEYPCHSLQEQRWFMMMVTPFLLEGIRYCVISHQDVTQRKCAEELVLRLSKIDSLTKLPNRRHFDEFLEEEWSRCARLNLPITVAIMDIDYFKLLNDHYGHQVGDDCLIAIGSVLNGMGKRPGDLFARYGGEEFSLVLSNTTTKQGLEPIYKIVNSIYELQIPHEKSPTKPIVTVSIGVATTYPTLKTMANDLIGTADRLLYSAKDSGRNQVIF